jgi:hypothetical protein
MEYDNTNAGASFKNTYKKKESQPDMTGTLNVEGVDYRMSGWFNESEKAGKYIKWKVAKKEEDSSPKDDASAPF